jgi:hypothetical protein
MVNPPPAAAIGLGGPPLGIERLAEGGRATEVAEENRDGLALLSGGGRASGKGGAAAVAEAGVVSVLAAAMRAGGHGRDCMTRHRLSGAKGRTAAWRPSSILGLTRAQAPIGLP